jgi:hypothetical protein
MDNSTAPALIAEHFAALGRDEDGAAAIYAEDAVLEYPQSHERIRGKANIIASRRAYPGRPMTFEVNRTTGGGDSWTTEFTLRYDGAEPHRAVKIHDLKDGLVVRERIYIAEPWEAPAYRAEWAEVIPEDDRA